ncbi:MAG: hypothetical protein ACR2GY_04940 [Phycisphaerales bacterium]
MPDPQPLWGRRSRCREEHSEAKLHPNYGFLLWGVCWGESAGSLENIIALLMRSKKALVYFSAARAFFSITSVSELRSLLERCDGGDISQISRKIGLTRALGTLESASQSAFEF